MFFGKVRGCRHPTPCSPGLQLWLVVRGFQAPASAEGQNKHSFTDPFTHGPSKLWETWIDVSYLGAHVFFVVTKELGCETSATCTVEEALALATPEGPYVNSPTSCPASSLSKCLLRVPGLAEIHDWTGPC